MVGDVVDDDAADHEPEAAADRRERREQPDAPGTRSRGNSSRMIPKQSGKMPPPTPCMTRPATTIRECRPERGDDRAGGEREPARSRAAGACRTCRRAGRRAACRPRPRAGSRYRPRDAARVGVQLARSSGIAGMRVVCRARTRARRRRGSAASGRCAGAGRGGRHRRGGARRKNRSLTTPAAVDETSGSTEQSWRAGSPRLPRPVSNERWRNDR